MKHKNQYIENLYSEEYLNTCNTMYNMLDNVVEIKTRKAKVIIYKDHAYVEYKKAKGVLKDWDDIDLNYYILRHKIVTDNCLIKIYEYNPVMYYVNIQYKNNTYHGHIYAPNM